MMSKKKLFSPARLKLLDCFSCSEDKCTFICSASDDCIEALGSLLKVFLQSKLKLPNLHQITKALDPIRVLLRILADKKTKTRTKRKILLNFAIKIILYPILEQDLIPGYSEIVKKVNKNLKK